MTNEFPTPGTTRKPGASSRTASASAPKPAKPRPVEAVSAAPSPPELKRRELLAEVVRRSNVKKKFAKPVLEAALEAIGEALADGRELNLEPLGKVKINRMNEQSGKRVFVARIRQSASGAADRTQEDTGGVKVVVAEPQQ